MLDFTRLKNQESSFWNNHDRTKANTTLFNFYDWIVKGGGIYPSFPIDHILDSENLSSLYAYENNQDLSTIVDTINYTDLINWYSGYLNDMITEIQNYEAQLKAQQQKSIFDSIIKAVTQGVNIISYAIAGGIIIFALSFIKKKG